MASEQADCYRPDNKRPGERNPGQSVSLAMEHRAAETETASVGSGLRLNSGSDVLARTCGSRCCWRQDAGSRYPAIERYRNNSVNERTGPFR